MRKKVVAGNWKMNLLATEVEAFIAQCAVQSDEVSVMIAPSAMYLERMLSLKSKGFELVVTDFSPSAVAVEDYEPKRPVALVMGTELTGISDVARELADAQVIIPMSGFSQSLNVSVATGIAVAQLSRKTMKLKSDFPPSEEEKWDAMILWAKNAIYWSDQIIREFEMENQISST